MITIFIKDEIFRTNPSIFINCDAFELKKTVEKAIKEEWTDFDVEKEDKVNSLGAVWHIIDKKNNSYHILWIKKFDWTVPSLASLVHEVRHLTDELLTDRGVSLKDREATAYFNEFLFDKILTGISKHEKIKKD